MTAKEAIAVINSVKFILDNEHYSDDVENALDMAIEALKAQEKTDLISRQDAIDAINELHDNPNAWLDLAVDALEKLPSVQPDYTEWEMREAFNEGYSRGAKAVQEKRETCGLQCLRCKQTYEYTWETMDEMLCSWIH